MADEPNKTLPHEGDDAQPLTATSMTQDSLVTDAQLVQSADTSEQDHGATQADEAVDEGPLRDALHDESPVAESPASAAEPTDESQQPVGASPADDTDVEGAMQWISSPNDESTFLMPAATAQFREVVETPEYTYPSPEDEPQLRDVGATLAGWLRGRARAMATVIAAHRILITIASLLCVLAVLGVVLFGIDAAKMPPDSLIKQDAQERLLPPSYTVGLYADDDPLVLKTVDIESKGSSGSQRNAFEVDVVATFANAGMQTQADALLTYERKGDDWECIEATVGNASHHATAGVSEACVLEQAHNLLQEADTSDGTEPLADLYRDATIELSRGKFDEERQTDSVNLHFSSNGTFVSYECTLSLIFRFAPASGAWELASATVSDGARELGFGPLLGTWKGTFSSQASSSAKCLAARDAGLAVTITRADMTGNGSAVIEGTLSGVAHLHADLQTDANTTEGDTTLEDIPFSGKLSSGDVEQDVISLLAGNNPKRSQAGIVFDCTTQDVAGGSVTLTLEFGQASAPDAASATLTTTHDYEDTILLVMSYKREARFADSFSLEKTS